MSTAHPRFPAAASATALSEPPPIGPAEHRARAIASLGLLDQPTDERFARIVRLACRILGVPAAYITLVDVDRQFHVAQEGAGGPREVPLERSICQYTVADDRPLVVEDARRDERLRGNPAVTEEGGIRFYAGHPLHSPSGVPVGALCVTAEEPRTLTADQLDLLGELAALAQDEFARTRELDRAREVQLQLLPRSKPELPGYELAGASVSTGMVSGDFFDWHSLGEQFQIVVADVMGKGLGAALIGAAVRTAIRGTSRFNDLATSLSRLAGTMEWDLAETGSFVTMFAARLDTQRHELSYVDAGHGLAGIVTADGVGRLLESDGLPLGPWASGGWQVNRVALEPGDALVCVSDGLLDLFDDLPTAVEATRRVVRGSASAQEVVDKVVRFGRSRVATDDVTVVVLRRLPS